MNSWFLAYSRFVIMTFQTEVFSILKCARNINILLLIAATWNGNFSFGNCCTKNSIDERIFLLIFYPVLCPRILHLSSHDISTAYYCVWWWLVVLLFYSNDEVPALWWPFVSMIFFLLLWDHLLTSACIE